MKYSAQVVQCFSANPQVQQLQNQKLPDLLCG